MNRHSTVACFIGISILALATIALAADDPFVGTWKFNVAKSIGSGIPPRNMTVNYDIQGDTLKYAYDAIDKDGKPNRAGGTFIIDGKEKANPRTNIRGESILAQRIDAYTISAVTRKDGQPINTRTEVVSKDGKTLTIILKGKTGQGQLIDRVAVFEKE